MTKSILSIAALALALSSCQSPTDPFIIQKHNIGLLTDSTRVKDLNLAFPNDSIVQFKKGDEFRSGANKIDIYAKGGDKLLSLSTSQILDSTAVIKNVQILDSRYKTDKGISAISSFKDISENYTISKINNLISNIVISVDEINASFTIDKKELPANLRFDLNLNIESSQIPDNAKVKFFMLHWL
ncbi:MAG: hypothetical protein BM564_10645 [Bacteroidetes bacterium MedPE-SWsnd-G2]|nr:MAG: hypothetical protein BM564_10645 [Bacteroidetes bacterium MedPE-SWsnd-G2]